MTHKQSKIDKLIFELCPNGVEFKELGEIGTLIRGNGLQKNDFTESGIGCIHYGQMYTYYGTFATKTKSFVSLEKAKKLKKAQKGDVLITGVSENVEDICKPLGWFGDEICISGDMFAFRHNQNTKFITYLLLTTDFRKYKEKYAQGAKVTRVKSDKILKYKIPLPPLAIQEEIVKTLNTFTELETKLEAELEAELEARTEQYEFYRSELLMSGNDVELILLENLADFKYGFTDKAKDRGNTRFVRITDINKNGKLRTNDSKYLDLTNSNKEYLLKKGDILMARTGATYGKTMLFNEEYEAIYASFLIRIRFDENRILPSYYWHYSQSDLYWEQTKKLVNGGAQPQFNANVLKLISIPVPPITTQERIVSILDKFDALVNDISMGLPAELAARRHQYEFYRNKLLTFNEYVG